MNKVSTCYSILWKYKVTAERKIYFEKEYGPEGTWFHFFRQSEDYLGSHLQKLDGEENAWLLIDQWTDRRAYERFKRVHAHAYQELSERFTNIYTSETMIGGCDGLPVLDLFL